MGMTWKNLLTLIAGVGATAMWIAQAPADDDAVFAMPAGKTYVGECGGCHTAYAPGLLPARSWQRIMAGLGEHFGEDATLEEPQHLAILKELENQAADRTHASVRIRRINDAIPANAAPLRITETGYFRYMHDEVPSRIWRRKRIGHASNCGACHVRANEGRYGEREVRIPAD